MQFRNAAVAVFIVSAASTASAQSLSVGNSSLSNSDCVDNNSDLVSFTAVAQSSASSTPTIQLFVTTSDCPSPSSSDTSVSAPDGSVTLVSSRSVTSTDESGNSATLYARQLAKSDCSTGVSYTWNVCLYEFWQVTSTTSGTTYQHLLSTSTITYDSLGPGAPRLDSVTAGDQHLNVSFTSPGDSDISKFEILVAPKNTDYDESIAVSAASDGGVYTSYDCYPDAELIDFSESTTAGMIPSGSSGLLQDGLTYVVQVRAVDTAGNTGPCSNPIDGTPQVIDDFWRLYKKAGGQGTGCGSATGAALAPAIVVLIWLGIRKGRAIRSSRRPLADERLIQS